MDKENDLGLIQVKLMKEIPVCNTSVLFKVKHGFQ